MDLENLHGNTADGVIGLYRRSVGRAVNGSAGLRDDTCCTSIRGCRRAFDPCGSSWPSTVRSYGRLDATGIEFNLEGQGPQSVWVRGEEIVLEPEQRQRVSLADQGPQLSGRPSLEHVLSLQLDAGVEVPNNPWK